MLYAGLNATHNSSLTSLKHTSTVLDASSHITKSVTASTSATFVVCNKHIHVMEQHIPDAMSSKKWNNFLLKARYRTTVPIAICFLFLNFPKGAHTWICLCHQSQYAVTYSLECRVCSSKGNLKFSFPNGTTIRRNDERLSLNQCAGCPDNSRYARRREKWEEIINICRNSRTGQL